MKHSGQFSATAAIIVAMVLLFASPARADNLQIRLQVLVDSFRTDFGFPGATVAIALPETGIVSVATGAADIEAGKPMTTDSRMLAASIGKSFVALTVLALESEGMLSQADLVREHLGARDWFARLPNHATMTVGDLLRHAAGLPDHVHLRAFTEQLAARITAGGDAMSPEQAIAFVLDQEPLFPAATGWAYSDTGYLLLGLVIEAVTGRSYYDVLTERFLTPLALDSTAPSNRRDLADLAAGYTVPANPFGLPPRTMDASGRLVWDPATEWTGGGLVSTSHDLALWGHRLFSGTAMNEPYLDRLLSGIPIGPENPGTLYGAGVVIQAATSRGPVYGHGGWIPGYISNLRYYADYGIAVAFQINSDAGIPDDRSDLVAALEAALADLAIGSSREPAPPRS